MAEKRKKIWIDRFQTYLFFRIALYFLVYQAFVWIAVLIERDIIQYMSKIVGPAGVIYAIIFMTSLVIILSVLFIYDAVKFAHRIVGPLYRFRKTINAVAAGEETDLVTLRQGDFLQEMKDDFNQMLLALEKRGAVELKKAEQKQGEDRPLSV